MANGIPNPCNVWLSIIYKLVKLVRRSGSSIERNCLSRQNNEKSTPPKKTSLPFRRGAGGEKATRRNGWPDQALLVCRSQSPNTQARLSVCSQFFTCSVASIQNLYIILFFFFFFFLWLEQRTPPPDKSSSIYVYPLSCSSIQNEKRILDPRISSLRRQYSKTFFFFFWYGRC